MDTELKSMLVKILESQTKLESEIGKNSIKLEAIENKIAVIAEVQNAHKEQVINEFESINKLVLEKTGLIETALKNISLDTKEVKESIEVLKDMTGRHEVDINILKRRPV